MIGWNNFYVFVIVAMLCWLTASLISFFKRNSRFSLSLLAGFQVTGMLVLLAFIIGLAIRLHRPPLRTMGEMRLWYAFFLSLIGFITFLRWRYKWILLFTSLLSGVFLLINVFRPEIHDHYLMPALQSVWFVPHVIVYMLSYAFFGCSFVIALAGLYKQNPLYTASCDRLVNTGISLFTLGMLLGAIWAKEAWGHYWTWDPKEIWAAVTWMLYLLYLHIRIYKQKKYKLSYLILIIAFFALQMCWYGINLFPSERESLHIYG